LTADDRRPEARIFPRTPDAGSVGKPSSSTPETRPYAGDITPEEAWKLLSDNPDAVLVDCRTDAEWRFVGVPDISGLGRDVVYVQWSGVDGKRNETFVDELIEAGVKPGDRPVAFLCRSGNRSIPAAAAATAAGIGPSYNVLDGFEGHLDASGHRGGSGWRAVGLPWKQS
jgi:rhodanese-related sulfurtransferase